MTETKAPPTVIKSLRVDPELWLRVIKRAQEKAITPNAWLVRCIKDALKRVEGTAP